MPSKTAIILLVLIVLLGGFLRTWSSGSTELIHDEGLDIFRSIGYVDYLDSQAQSTPIQWLFDKPLPWWTSLSFHDDPPIFFIIQHLFIGVFGENLFAARLPSALAGIGSIILIFFIVRRLMRASANNFVTSEYAGLIAAFILSINFAHIWISRIAIIESLAIFFILLNIYFFLRFTENHRKWFLFGITLGLCALTKYTSIFLVPVYIIYILIFNREIFKKRGIYLAIFAAIIIFSPVIVYNIYLYQTFGHFDLQIASLLHQNVSYWQGKSGKTQEPFSNIIENMRSVYSAPMLVLWILGALALLVALVRKNAQHDSLRRILIFALSLVFCITFLLIFIGSAIRFIVFYSIPMAIIISILSVAVWTLAKQNGKTWVKATACIIFVLFLISEVTFTAYAAKDTYRADFGVMALDRYFDSIFKNARPPGLLEHNNPHLNDIIKQYASSYPNTLPPTGIIYDDNIELPHRLWLFSRRELYHGIPIMPASAFWEIIQKGDTRQFDGFTVYFVKADIGAPISQGKQLPDADHIEQFLINNFKLKAVATFADDSQNPAFRVYKFSFK